MVEQCRVYFRADLGVNMTPQFPDILQGTEFFVWGGEITPWLCRVTPLSQPLKKKKKKKKWNSGISKSGVHFFLEKKKGRREGRNRD